MANDFRILKTGEELSNNRSENKNVRHESATTWWLIGFGTVALVAIVVVAFNYGQSSVMPKLGAIKPEKDALDNQTSNLLTNESDALNSAISIS